MAKICPVTNDKVLYLDCVECEDRECEKIPKEDIEQAKREMDALRKDKLLNAFPCNMIVTDTLNRVAIVKDTCEGCKYDKEHCALYDLYESAGLFKDWENWNVPTFRERLKDAKN